MYNRHQKALALPYSGTRSYLKLIARNDKDNDMKHESIDLTTAKKVEAVAKKAAPPARPAEIRIPAELLDNDMFFGA